MQNEKKIPIFVNSRRPEVPSYASYERTDYMETTQDGREDAL